MNLRFSKTPRTLKALFALFFIVPLFTPVNFVIIQPGDGTPLFPKVLTISQSDAPTYTSDGQIFLLSIWVSNPDAKILGAEVIGCWVRADCVVLPRSVIYKKNTSTKEEQKKSKIEMKTSQSDALTATKALLAKRYPKIVTSQLTDQSIKVKLPNIGGPSGGLIFSLGLIELLTPENILQGKKIAGTGTISAGGEVGAIGGISEKIIAARKAGATILFASKKNCDEIPESDSGISVIAVSSLEEALNYLQNPLLEDFRGVTGCTSLRA
jgi:Lon-like protease